MNKALLQAMNLMTYDILGPVFYLGLSKVIVNAGRRYLKRLLSLTETSFVIDWKREQLCIIFVWPLFSEISH